MDHTISFSIVMPVYNVSGYLEEALNCLRQQTYPWFEAVIVDDCATDGSGEIADRFVERTKDARFCVIHLEQNKGVAAARNRGMREAEGDYILFLDPDDFYETTMLETLAKEAKAHPWDIMLFGYTEDYYRKDGTLFYQITKSLPGKKFFALAEKTEEFCDTILEAERETMYGYPWNKAYRLEYLRQTGVSFPVVPHIEDILFNISAFEDVTSFLLLPQVLYHYRNQGQQRLTGKYLPEYFDLQKERILAFLEQQSRWRKQKKEQLPDPVLEEAANFYFRAFQSFMVREIGHGTSKKEILLRAEAELKEPLYLLLCGHLSKKGRAAEFLYRPLAQRKLMPAYVRSVLIYTVQKRFPGLYARLKQNR